MHYRIILFLWICLGASISAAVAQDFEKPENDDPLVTTSLGIHVSGPFDPTANYVGFAWGLSAGVGYNFDRRNALIGEFMWNALYPTNGAVEPIRIALLTSNVSGHGNLFAFTANYRLELRGREFGTYFIGGPGWYYRTAALSRPIPEGTTISCTPALLWWGYNCAAPLVVNNLTEVHHNAGALGFNAGMGITLRVGEAPYRMYVESRYHFAPTGAVSTKLVAVTVGIRY